jgi:hypothetical protein
MEGGILRKPLSLGKCKIGFYEFEEKISLKMETESGNSKTVPYLKKFKPRNLKKPSCSENTGRR